MQFLCYDVSIGKLMVCKKTKCLIIHGFGGGVHEVEPLAKYLVNLGYEVSCPVLKGHSRFRKEMNKATYKDWIYSAEQELLRLKETTDEIVVIGFSMGGLIAFNLACKHKFKAIITINTPIFYWNPYRVLLNLADDVKNRTYNHSISVTVASNKAKDRGNKLSNPYHSGRR